MQTEGCVFHLTKAEQAYVRVLFEESYKKIYNVAYRHLININRDSIEDVIQETFTRACEDFKSMSSYNSAEAWLVVTAHHVALDEVKRCTRLAALNEEMLTSMVSPVDKITDSETESVIVPYDSLSDENLEILNRYYHQGKTSEEIAEELGKKPATIRKRLERMRETLKGKIKFMIFLF